MRRFFTWSQKRLIEKQNPELASVMRKLERARAEPRPAADAAGDLALHPRREAAYDDYLAVARDQGALPEAPNRAGAPPAAARCRAPAEAEPAAGTPKKAGKRRR